MTEMDILVCVKRVPETAEAELLPDRSGRALDTTDLAWEMNEWDRVAVEAAVRWKEEHDARITVLTVGDEEDEEVLRRALAMGCDQALRLWDPAFAGADAWRTARILAAAIRGRPHDLVLTGAVSGDWNQGLTGPFLAALLDLPWVTLATGLRPAEGGLEVRHEVEDGLEREVLLPLPALVTVQTGLAEPRYVSIRGIRRVAGVEIPVLDAAALGLEEAATGAAATRLLLEELRQPATGGGAEILEGRPEEVVAALADRLHEHGAL